MVFSTPIDAYVGSNTSMNNENLKDLGVAAKLVFVYDKGVI